MVLVSQKADRLARNVTTPVTKKVPQQERGGCPNRIQSSGRRCAEFRQMHFKVGALRNAHCRGIGVLEVLIAILIVGFSMAAIVNSYVVCARESDRAAYSLSAQSLALGRLEQVRAAKWDLAVLPAVDDVQSSNFPPAAEIL